MQAEVGHEAAGGLVSGAISSSIFAQMETAGSRSRGGSSPGRPLTDPVLAQIGFRRDEHDSSGLAE